MREIKIGEKIVRLRATPPALLFYRQEFKADLIGDLISFQKISEDPSAFDSVALLQMIWAMAKADNYNHFPSFVTWVGELDSFDFGDAELLRDVIEEATAGFFRGGNSG
ncbi:MAG: hypothetical protein PHG75_03950 [Syntrophomonas sp.]|nr:hypothetical protein [Syntrophomonas sp.]